MYKCQWVCIVLFSYGSQVLGDSCVDLYGLPENEAQPIVHQYANQIQALERQLNRAAVQKNPTRSGWNRLILQKQQLIKQIQEQGHFAFVDIQSVQYPREKTMCSTIEVIPENAQERMRFTNRHSITAPHVGKRGDIVDEMHDFTSKVMRSMLGNNWVPDDNNAPCPVYHCIASFNRPEFAPYLIRFNQAMRDQKAYIIDVLNHDPDPQRRADASFLIGHDTDPRHILNILKPYIADPSSQVRNNVLRVIAMTIAKSHITHIDATPFVTLLDSPYLTDRNKALAILINLADTKEGQATILQLGRQRLWALLQLKQPNNHTLAYLILKKISHLSYGDRALSEWHTWLKLPRVER